MMNHAMANHQKRATGNESRAQRPAAGGGRGAGARDAAAPRMLPADSPAPAPWPELAGFEFGLVVSWHAFERWMVRCMRAAGQPELGVNDILVLQYVHHRDREKRLADICFTLGYEDTHVVTYALRKLATAGLVEGRKVGKEVFHAITPPGRAAVARYCELRRRCLLDDEVAQFQAAGDGADDAGTGALLSAMARRLRAASGWYDQAARAVASL